MLKDKLSIDEKDAKLLSIYMEDPEVSQTELANVLKLSQPSVNVRINKLKKRGILASSIGIEFNKTEMVLVRIDFTAPDATDVLEEMKSCSFFVNGFVMSGKHNASVMIVGHNLKKIDSIVNAHLRSKLDVKDINMSVVVSTVKPFICSINLEREQNESCQDPNTCSACLNRPSE